MRNYLKAVKSVSLPGSLFWVILLIIGVVSGYGQDITPDLYDVLQYRHIGPPGNRTSAVCGEPGNPLVFYIGASSGGVPP